MEDEQNVLEHAKYLKSRGRLDEAIEYLESSIHSLAAKKQDILNLAKYLINLAITQSELMAKNGIFVKQLEYLKIARDASIPQEKNKAVHSLEWKVLRLHVCRKLVEYYNK